MRVFVRHSNIVTLSKEEDKEFLFNNLLLL